MLVTKTTGSQKISSNSIYLVTDPILALTGVYACSSCFSIICNFPGSVRFKHKSKLESDVKCASVTYKFLLAFAVVFKKKINKEHSTYYKKNILFAKILNAKLLYQREINYAQLKGKFLKI